MRFKFFSIQSVYQPPSGGCVLKLGLVCDEDYIFVPAAFRRLCVETVASGFGRRCVYPAAFRRLCVETRLSDFLWSVGFTSRLQAAVC